MVILFVFLGLVSLLGLSLILLLINQPQLLSLSMCRYSLFFELFYKPLQIVILDGLELDAAVGGGELWVPEGA